MKVFILLGVLLCIAASEARRNVCYYGTWAIYRPGDGRFDPFNIDPTLCTHIIYSFFGLTPTGTVESLDPYLDLEEDWGRGNIRDFISLRNRNPAAKFLAAFGGWNFGSQVFSDMALNAQYRTNFANSVKQFLDRHGFDGIDLDWEYPNQREGSRPADKENLNEVIRALRSVLGNGYLITIATASAEFSSALSYNIPVMCGLVDMVNIMTYDLRGPWEQFTGLHSGMYAHPQDTSEDDRQLNVDAAVNYWLGQGCPSTKINLGLATYGRAYTLANANDNGVKALSWNPGSAGPWTREPGVLGFNEICSTSGWNRQWEGTQLCPYSYNGAQWVGYEDTQSLLIKLNYIKSKNLGGSMFWSLETDDFRGHCGQGLYPMVSLAAFHMEVIPDPPVVNPTPPPTAPPGGTTQPPGTTGGPGGGEFTCPGDGFFRHPTDCSRFYQCANGVAHPHQCGDGLYFDPSINACNWPQLVQC